MSRLSGFPPISASTAHTLILGSMPGAASLAAAQYYAHPRNLFWSLIGEIVGVDPALPYEQRTHLLAAKGFAVWDVLHACQREGSLDTDIEPTSIQANDFVQFLAEHPQVTRIFFNGATAEQLFRRHVLPGLDEAGNWQYLRLPSTSPANAGTSRAEKLAAWRAIAR